MKSATGLSYMTRDDERAQNPQPVGGIPKVFISYKKEEKKQVTDEGLLYTRDLAAKRIVNLSDCAVWHDGLLTPGGDYNTEIAAAIQECDAMVLLLTGNVLESKYIWDIEVRMALENNKEIIPVAFDFPKTKYGTVEEMLGNVHIISWPGGGDDDTPQREDRDFNDSLKRALDRLAVSSTLQQEINKIRQILNGESSLIHISFNNWYLMGRACLEGISVPKDEDKGIELLEAVANIGCTERDVVQLRCKALNTLFAHFIERYKDTEENSYLKRCRKYADLGAELGDAELTYRLGYMSQKGRGAGRDPEKAARIYEIAAQLGSAQAMSALGIMYREGEYVPKDSEKAFRLLSDAADRGDGEAMWNLAQMYDSGEGVERSEDMAEKWYVASAKVNGGYAMRKLGDFYKEDGDMASAFKWYYNSAQQGDGIAMRNLGHMYRRGTHVAMDYGKAFGWYYKAAAVGNFVAMRYLGLMFLRGMGVEKNEGKMQECFEKSVEFGGIRAANSLGRIYLEGEDLPCDASKAAYWYSIAAKMGNASAAKALEKLISDGVTVPERLTPQKAAPVEVSAPAERPVQNAVPEEKKPATPIAPLSPREAKAALKARKAQEKLEAKAAKKAAKEARKAARGK